MALEAGLVVGTFGLISYTLRMVDRGGLLAGLAVGYVIYSFGGRFLFLPLLTFHMIAGASTKYKYEVKTRRGAAEEKMGARGWRNVLANGVVAAVLAFLGGMGGSSVDPVYLAGFLGAVGTAGGDTVATEIGLLYRNPPRLITDLKRRVPAGTSGGVSILGEAAQVVSSLLIGATVILFAPSGAFATWALGVTVVASFAGSTMDSVIGATMQGMFKCRVCQRTIEKRVHCGEAAVHVRGMPWLGNNVVNLFAIAFGALVAVGLHILRVFGTPYGL